MLARAMQCEVQANARQDKRLRDRLQLRNASSDVERTRPVARAARLSSRCVRGMLSCLS